MENLKLLDGVEIKQVSEFKYDIYYQSLLVGAVLFDSYNNVFNSSVDGYKKQYAFLEEAASSLVEE